jgi:hypothetical protein
MFRKYFAEMKTFEFLCVHNYLIVAKHGTSVMIDCGQPNEQTIKTKHPRFTGFAGVVRYLSCGSRQRCWRVCAGIKPCTYYSDLIVCCQE